MIPIFQRNWYTEAYRLSDGNYLAKANYLDSNTEKTARVKLMKGTLEIYHAEVATYREGAKEVAQPLVVFPEMNGIKAYLGAGRPLKAALHGDLLLIDLMTEAIGTIIQADFSFYQELGFKALEDIENYWDETYSNTCFNYSHLALRTTRFRDFAKYQIRDNKLFCRYQNYTVFQVAPQQLEIMASFNDTFHEMAVTLKTSGPQQLVTEANGCIRRCPDQNCHYAEETLKKLSGKSMLDRSTAKVCGGPDGCAHLAHIIMEAIRALNLAQPNCG